MPLFSPRPFSLILCSSLYLQLTNRSFAFICFLDYHFIEIYFTFCESHSYLFINLELLPSGFENHAFDTIELDPSAFIILIYPCPIEHLNVIKYFEVLRDIIPVHFHGHFVLLLQLNFITLATAISQSTHFTINSILLTRTKPLKPFNDFLSRSAPVPFFKALAPHRQSNWYEVDHGGPREH